MADIIVLLLVAAAAGFAVRTIKRQKECGGCGCGGNCGGCSIGCGKREDNKKKAASEEERG